MAADSFLEFVRDQMRGLPDVRFRRMFGGWGIYGGKSFFGIVFKGRLYFKVSDATRADYVDRGMETFRPSVKQTLTSFYEVPAEILESPPLLRDWAADSRRAAEISVRRSSVRRKKPNSHPPD
jgi:DNA transformation protein